MFKLPESLRNRFRDPFGPVYTTAELQTRLHPDDLIVAIGDLVSKTAIDLGFRPKIIIVDYRTQRGPLDEQSRMTLERYGKTVLRVKNPAATITKELIDAVAQGFRLAGPVRIEVEGEEDLAGVPVFAQAPNGAVVLYGMPGRGVVLVKMDESMRRLSHELLDQMRG